MNASSSRYSGAPAFTLIEMLAALAVLVILLAAMAQMFSMTSATIKNSVGHQDADGQARMIFDRMAADLAACAKRDDLDYDFISQSGNDRFFFYSESPGFLPQNPPSTIQNTASLVGYQVNSGYQLERLGYGLNWDGAGASVTRLTFPATATSFAPDPASTINDGNSGEWSSVIGNDTATGNFHVLGETVFRLEFCFLLKDGTYSVNPMLFTSPAGWPAASHFYTPQSGAPTPASDSSQNYAVGSRWWDTTNNRGYICLQSTVGAAEWRPIGWDDVGGVVVALGMLDNASRQILSARGTSLSQAAAQLPDAAASDLTASPPKLMGANWQAVVTSSSFATTAGLPAPVAAQVRVYQRCIMVDGSSL